MEESLEVFKRLILCISIFTVHKCFGYLDNLEYLQLGLLELLPTGFQNIVNKLHGLVQPSFL
jgi:hypothetical protein